MADEAGSAAGEVLGLGAGGAEAADVLARVKAAAPAGPSGLAAARIGRSADPSATSGTWQPKGHQHVRKKDFFFESKNTREYDLSISTFWQMDKLVVFGHRLVLLHRCIPQIYILRLCIVTFFKYDFSISIHRVLGT